MHLLFLEKKISFNTTFQKADSKRSEPRAKNSFKRTERLSTRSIQRRRALKTKSIDTTEYWRAREVAKAVKRKAGSGKILKVGKHKVGVILDESAKMALIGSDVNAIANGARELKRKIADQVTDPLINLLSSDQVVSAG